ncbi:hypothetical protein BK135_01175 [Paenibacillus peoriae]|nr:hypothetical protein BK135_01175 [Paenibacillus peoriae]
MLADRERKLLRILYNYSAGRRRLPTMKELEIKMGRSVTDIKRVGIVIRRSSHHLERQTDTIRNIKPRINLRFIFLLFGKHIPCKEQMFGI